MPSQTRAIATAMTAHEKPRAIASTPRAARATMKPRAPAPLPSRREAPKTRSEITRQAPPPPIAARIPPMRLSSSRPAMKPTTAASRTIRPRAEPEVPVVPASMPIAMPMPRSLSKSTVVKPNGVGTSAPIRHTSPMTEVPQPPHKRRAHTSTRHLERYAGLFAERTTVMRSSAMRDLMAVTARPEVISLAGGLPDTSTFPPERLAAQMSKIAAESAAAALQYGPTEGFDETKDCIVEVMAAEGMLPDPDDIVITTGGQQAIDLVTKTLVDPGDVVICEAPTYPGAVPVFCSYQADVRQVEMDADGMRIDLLEDLLADLQAEGKRPKFVYTVPSFQNPAGVTLSLERRARLVELAHEHEMLVVEDSPYGLL